MARKVLGNSLNIKIGNTIYTNESLKKVTKNYKSNKIDIRKNTNITKNITSKINYREYSKEKIVTKPIKKMHYKMNSSKIISNNNKIVIKNATSINLKNSKVTKPLVIKRNPIVSAKSSTKITKLSKTIINSSTVTNKINKNEVNNLSNSIKSPLKTVITNVKDTKLSITPKIKVISNPSKKTNHKSKDILSKDKLVNIKNVKRSNVISLLPKAQLIKNIPDKINKQLNSIDDSGARTVALGISTIVASNKVFKVSQSTTNRVLIPAAKRTVNFAGTTFKVSKGVISGNVKLNKDTFNKLKKMAINKVVNITPIKNAIRISKFVNSTINTTYRYSIFLGKKAINAAILTKGIVTGNIKIRLSKDTLNNIRNLSIKGIKIGGNLLKYSVVKGGKLSLKTGKFIYSSVRKPTLFSINQISSILSNSNDTGAQAVALGINTGKASIKVIKETPKVIKSSARAVKTTVNIPIKTAKKVYSTGKGIAKTIRNIRKFGIKATIKYHRSKLYKKIIKGSKAVSDLIVNLLKKVSSKLLIPIVAIIVCFVLLVNILTAPVSAIASMFSGSVTTTDTGEDIDEHNWLIGKINKSRMDFVKEIKKIYKDNLVSNSGNYHIVRLFNDISGSEIELSDTNILNSIYSPNEYLQIIEPLFHTIMLSKYNLEPKKSDLEDTYNDIWNNINKVSTEELPTEYCGSKCSCGIIHADLSTCPNYEFKKHSSYTCDKCCWSFYTCKGHLYCDGHEHNDDCPDKCKSKHYCDKTEDNKEGKGCKTKYCNDGKPMSSPCSNCEKHDACNGYYECKGHKVLAIRISKTGLNNLIDKYLLNDIHSLEAKTRTAAEEEQLKKLKDDYEFYLAYKDNCKEQYNYSEITGGSGGGSGEIVDLNGVTLNEVTEFACSFVGNPYVYGGTDINNGIDCSAFVQYVWAHFGVSIPRATPGQCQAGVAVPSLAEALPGDLILYSAAGTDIDSTHVVMYLGNGKIVHASNSAPYPQGGIKIDYVYGPIYKIRRVAKQG